VEYLLLGYVLLHSPVVKGMDFYFRCYSCKHEHELDMALMHSDTDVSIVQTRTKSLLQLLYLLCEVGLSHFLK